MQLLMANHTIKKPMSISFDVLVKLDNYIFSYDFVVLDSKVYFEMYIILWRSFLDTGRALVDMEKVKLKFRINNKEVTFNVCRTVKQPTYMRVGLIINNHTNPGSQPYVFLDEV